MVCGKIVGRLFSMAGAAFFFFGANAYATNNVDVVSMQTPVPYFFPLQKEIMFSAVRYAGNPADPVTLTATEAADGSSVTIVVSSAAAGGLTTSSPCYKTAADTVVCPMSYPTNNVVKSIYVTAPVGDNNITIDTPTIIARVSVGNGNDTISVPHCTTSSITASGGNDVIYGGSGVDTIYADGGTDTIYVYDSPAGADNVYCGSAAVESPSDTVIVDTADVIKNTNCLAVNQGP